MQVKKTKAPPGTPAPAPNLRDMDIFHRAANTNWLADLLHKIAKGQKK